MRAEIEWLDFFFKWQNYSTKLKIIYWRLKTDSYQYRVKYINEQKEVYIREMRKINNTLKQKAKFPEVLGLAFL